MFSQLTTKTLERINVVEKFITITQSLKEGDHGLDGTQVKIYSVSSCVMSLYAIFESSVKSLIADYLDNLPGFIKYNDLDENFKNEYRIGIAYILNRIATGRMPSLRHDDVIRRYNDAINNKKNYKFDTVALTRHEQNLRLQLIQELFSRIQLTDLRDWLGHHADIVRLFQVPPNLSDTIYQSLESALLNFIKLRNDAAHGALENLEGKENLIEYCQLIKGIVIALSSYLHKSLLLLKRSKNNEMQIGTVSETFQNEAFVAKIKKGTALMIDLPIHFVGTHYCYSQKIVSLQVNDVNVKSFTSPQDEYEVGIKCAAPAKKNAEMYIV